MKLHHFTNEIIAIAKKNNVSWDVGADMFLANVRNAGNEGLPYYEGAKEVDFAELKECEKELAESKISFVEAYNKHNTEIINLRKDGKFEEVVKLMEG